MSDRGFTSLSSDVTVYVKFGVVCFWVLSASGMAGWLASAVVGPIEGLGTLMAIGAVGLWATLGPGSLKTASGTDDELRIGGFFREQPMPWSQVVAIDVSPRWFLPPAVILTLKEPCHWGVSVRFLLPRERADEVVAFMRERADTAGEPQHSPR